MNIKLTTEVEQLILKARDKGYSQTAIAKALGISQPSVSMFLKRHGKSGHLTKQTLDIYSL